MAEFTLTKWLDPILDYFAKEAGMPVEEYSSRVGGEGLGAAVEGITDYVARSWFSKLVQFIAGAAAGGYATFGKDVNPRLRKELLTFGLHELFRVVDPSPEEIVKMREEFQKFLDAVTRGDWQEALKWIIRSPEELKKPFEGLTAPTSASTPPLEEKTIERTVTREVEKAEGEARFQIVTE